MKRLNLSELLDIYDTLSCNLEFSNGDKEKRRSLWRDYIKECYPELKPCPFCGGSPEFSPMVRTESIWYYSRGASIYCPCCDYTFKSRYVNEDCIKSWNTRVSGV